MSASRTAPPSARSDMVVPTLDAVRRIIPARCYERRARRGVALLAIDTMVYLALLALCATVQALAAQLVVSVVLGVAVSSLFVLGHDAAHEALLPWRWANRLAAFATMVPSLHVREGWVFGHNRVHHGFTVRRDMDFVWHPTTPEEYLAMSPWRQRQHRFEWSALGSGVYYLRRIWWRKMIRFTPPDRHAAAVVRDRRWMALVAAVGCMGALWVGWLRTGSVIGAIWMLVRQVFLPFLVFCQIIGATVHIHHVQPDLAWWEGREWTRSKAQLVGTTVMRPPKVVDLVLHHIFIHVPHHVDARIPCYELARAAAAIEAAYPGLVTDRRLRLRDYVASTRRCKVFDFAGKQWLGYPHH